MANSKSLHADVTWQHTGIKSIARVNGKSVVMDSAVAAGGTDAGPSPLEMLLVSLGGCIIAMLAIVAQKRSIVLNDVQIKVDGDVTPQGLSELRYQIEVDSPAPAEQIEKLISQAETICPVKKALGIPVVRV